MKQFFSCLYFLFILIAASAQNTVTISGIVKNSLSNEAVPAASIMIKGTQIGTTSNDEGRFSLTTSQNFPITIVISSIGYTTQEITLQSAKTAIEISLEPTYALGQEIVVAASRVPERLLESPVTIERINSAAIVNTPAPSYYDMLANLKGVDVVTSSLTFKTVSTRGFNSSGNIRFNQLVDGMDNQAPGLNFPVGSVIGITELDVDNMELLSGASSALYGPGGMTGSLLITSKDPFKYPGLSFQIKQGMNHVDRSQRSLAPYYDWSVRWAQKLSDKFAFKITSQLLQAKDWIATDETNYNRLAGLAGRKIPGNRNTDPAYDGINVYGDETVIDVRPFMQGALAGDPTLAPIVTPFLSTPQMVSRTGYKEKEMLEPDALNFKITGGLYYMLSSSTELSAIAYWGTGNTVYTGSDRYDLKALKMAQYKIEAKSTNWFLRAYTTQEDAGESFNATITTRIFNESWKPSYNPASPETSWYPQYTQAFLTGAGTVYQTAYINALGSGQTPDQAAITATNAMLSSGIDLSNSARSFADIGRPTPGSSTFNHLFDSVRMKPISEGGGLFLDKTDLYMVEGQYNFTDLLKIGNDGNYLEVLVGGNYKRYVLNSEGTLFADTAGHINIDEWGGYLQLSQKFFKDVLKLTASGRFDKNENFKGKFTPRVSAVVQVAKNHNIRLSFQTAYRFPTTQNQWINLEVGGGTRLIGGLPELRKHYHFDTNPVYTFESFSEFAATGDPTVLQVKQFDEFKPESSTSYEIGYKGLIANKMLIDLYGYYSELKDFIGNTIVMQSSTGDIAGLATPLSYLISVNSKGKVKTRGAGISIQYLLPGNFNVNGNFYYDEMTDVPTDLQAGFNTPKYRTNIGFGNTGFLYKKRIGFNFIMKWQDAFFYESAFGNGAVSAFFTLDGQISYKFPKNNCIVKIGGANLLNKYYQTAFGNPQVGGLYYVSFGYNVF